MFFNFESSYNGYTSSGTTESIPTIFINTAWDDEQARLVEDERLRLEEEEREREAEE
jgi:hypothetical protein